MWGKISPLSILGILRYWAAKMGKNAKILKYFDNKKRFGVANILVLNVSL